MLNIDVVCRRVWLRWLDAGLWFGYIWGGGEGRKVRGGVLGVKSMPYKGTNSLRQSQTKSHIDLSVAVFFPSIVDREDKCRLNYLI